MRLREWIEARTGLEAALEAAATAPVRGGARWAYTLGWVLAFLIGLQALTGIVLSHYYAASVPSAWASVAFVQDQVTLGWLVRGVHSFGASLTIVVLGLHLVQVIAFGAYRAPRELTYWSGLVAMGLVVLTAATGYQLPWDQKGYWSNQVVTGITSRVPVVGPWLVPLLRGGAEPGNLTLARVFATHTMVLPLGLLLLGGLHVKLYRRSGPSAPGVRSDEELDRKAVPAVRQLERGLGACLLVLSCLIGVVVWQRGAELGAPADPSAPFIARPEWYFLPLFQLLKWFEGGLDVIATVIVPGLAAGVLFALPLLDRQPARRLRERKLALGVLVVLGAGWIGLGGAAVIEDERNPALQKQKGQAAVQAFEARKLARAGVLPEGGVAVWKNDPRWKSLSLWKEHCDKCHTRDGRGADDATAPDLKGFLGRAWLADFLRDPEHPTKYGKSKLEKRMKPVKGSDGERAALVEHVIALGGAKVDEAKAKRGAELFEAKECDGCHETDGKTDGDAPNLGGRGTRAWVRAVIADGSADVLFGERNRMPKFGKKLTDEELDRLVELVLEDGAK